MRTFTKENCNNSLRSSITDQLNRTIILSGIHAFEWSITILDTHSCTTTIYKNRIDARKDFRKYNLLKKSIQL